MPAPRRSMRNRLSCGAGALVAIGTAVAALRGLQRNADEPVSVAPVREPISPSQLAAKFAQVARPVQQDRAGHPLDDATRRQVQSSVRMILDLYGDTPYRLQEQGALPAWDDDPACAGMESIREAIFSLARWLRQGAPGADRQFDLSRESGIAFPLIQQNRMVSAIISASPALRQSLEIVRARGTAIRWGEPGTPGSSWRYDLNQIHLFPDYRITADIAVEDPMALFGGALILVQALSHELQHAQSDFRLLEAASFDSFEVFEYAFLAALAREEADALFGELQVAQQLFEATGVVLPLVHADYRCGEAQSIFHAGTMSDSEKRAALVKYVNAAHGAIASDYKAQALARWRQWRAAGGVA